MTEVPSKAAYDGSTDDDAAPREARLGHRSRATTGLRIVPVTHADANVYVERIHRHNGRLPGSIFRVGVADADGLVRGVAIAGLPKARLLCDGYTLEINRVCTDGTYNSCSMLYAACVRAARALGYRRVVTYTLESEQGASLRASGWTLASESQGGGWKRPNQPARRGQKDLHDLGPKWRWEITFGGADVVGLRWPDAVSDGQTDLFGESA